MGQVIADQIRETGELTIEIPALPRPTLKEIQKKYSWIRSIERDTSPERPVTLKLATVLCPDQTGSISGTEYERRIAPSLDVALGYQHWQWLLEHQNAHPAFMALLGKLYIDFPGIIVVCKDGNRNVPVCGQCGTHWDDDWSWLGEGMFGSDGRVAIADA